MKTLKVEKPAEFQSIIWDEASIDNVAMFEELLKEEIDDSQGVIREICFHILNAGGKRIRPLLVWYSGLIFGPGSTNLKWTAITAELIHMASLIHDDIIDGSEFRHNQPTAQKNWGNQRAVLGGDYLFAKAFGILARNKLTEPMGIMVGAIQNMCQGEILQDQDQFNSMVGMEGYYDRISKKTAVLIEASCKAGALVAGADHFQVEALGCFGLNLGLAFQIIDDILDICGDEIKMGKPKYTDLIKGNYTLPFILLMEQPKYQGWVREITKERNFNRSNLTGIEEVVRESGVMQRALAISASHLEQARKILKDFAETPARGFLENLTYKIQARAN